MERLMKTTVIPTALVLFVICLSGTALADDPWIYNAPGTYSTIGNMTYGPDGTYTTIGNMTYGPKSTCTAIGNMTYCN